MNFIKNCSKRTRLWVKQVNETNHAHWLLNDSSNAFLTVHYTLWSLHWAWCVTKWLWQLCSIGRQHKFGFSIKIFLCLFILWDELLLFLKLFHVIIIIKPNSLNFFVFEWFSNFSVIIFVKKMIYWEKKLGVRWPRW